MKLYDYIDAHDQSFAGLMTTDQGNAMVYETPSRTKAVVMLTMRIRDQKTKDTLLQQARTTLKDTFQLQIWYNEVFNDNQGSFLEQYHGVVGVDTQASRKKAQALCGWLRTHSITGRVGVVEINYVYSQMYGDMPEVLCQYTKPKPESTSVCTVQ